MKKVTERIPSWNVREQPPTRYWEDRIFCARQIDALFSVRGSSLDPFESETWHFCCPFPSVRCLRYAGASLRMKILTARFNRISCR